MCPIDCVYLGKKKVLEMKIHRKIGYYKKKRYI